MKLNPPLYKLCKSEGLAISNPHFYNKWQGWALAQNPLAYWNFNTTTGPFVDITGRSASVIPGTGMVLGAAGAVPGSLAITGLESLGSSGYATATYTGALIGLYQKLTIEMLVKFNEFKIPASGTASRRGYILFCGNSNTYLRYNDNFYLSASVGTVLNEEVYSSIQFGVSMDFSDFTKWYHLAVAIDALTGTYTFYLNGIPNTQIFSIPAVDYVVLGAGSFAFCGLSAAGGVASPHSMDELIIYDKCLTEEEVSMRFAQTGLTNGYVPVE